MSEDAHAYRTLDSARPFQQQAPPISGATVDVDTELASGDSLSDMGFLKGGKSSSNRAQTPSRRRRPAAGAAETTAS
jgi:hypothetical protein